MDSSATFKSYQFTTMDGTVTFLIPHITITVSNNGNIISPDFYKLRPMPHLRKGWEKKITTGIVAEVKCIWLVAWRLECYMAIKSQSRDKLYCSNCATAHPGPRCHSYCCSYCGIMFLFYYFLGTLLQRLTRLLP